MFSKEFASVKGLDLCFYFKKRPLYGLWASFPMKWTEVAPSSQDSGKKISFKSTANTTFFKNVILFYLTLIYNLWISAHSANSLLLITFLHAKEISMQDWSAKIDKKKCKFSNSQCVSQWLGFSARAFRKSARAMRMDLQKGLLQLSFKNLNTFASFHPFLMK